jgi:branched-chain amino acid aminotransferase
VSETINVNGSITPAEAAVVSPLDRGFLFGDSVYETIRTYGARPFLLGEHLARLRRSAERLEIPHERTVVDIETEIHRTIAAAGLPETAIRVVLTRGRGPLGYAPEDCGPPTLVIHGRPCPEIPGAFLREGVDVAIVDVTRNARTSLDPAIKSSNLLNNFLAWRAAQRLGAYEPILLNAAGRLTEGATSNLFVVRSERLVTPPLDDGLLEGITRGLVLGLARGARLEAIEESLGPDELRGADEAFLTSTLKGVLPIRRCDGWPIRHGRPGPITRRMMDLFQARVQVDTKTGSAPGSILR